jgi:hypothetical protein
MTTNDQPSNVDGGTLLRGTGWMYEGLDSEINKEEYLLGKKIGKNFELEGTAGQINAVEYDVAPPSIFASRANHQVHLSSSLTPSNSPPSPPGGPTAEAHGRPLGPDQEARGRGPREADGQPSEDEADTGASKESPEDFQEVKKEQKGEEEEKEEGKGQGFGR